MDKKKRSLADHVQLLRWLIPGLMVSFGAGYPIIDHLVLQQRSVLNYHVLRESIMLGSIGPLLMWISLSWLSRVLAEREEADKLLTQRNQELSAVNTVASTVGASLDLQTILADALEQILAVTGVEVGEIFLLDEDEEAVVMTAHCGILVDTFREIERFPVGEGFPGRVVLTGEPLVTTDLANDLRYLRRQVVEAGIGTYACVPLRTPRRVVGTLSVAALGQRQISSNDLDLLTAIGQQLSLAIENARLFEAEQTQRELANTLRRISRALNASLKVDDVLQEILQQLGRVLIIDAGLVLLVEGEQLTVAACRGKPELNLEKLLGYTFNFNDSPPMAEVLRKKQPFTFCDPERVDVFSDGIGRIEDIQWCLVVPMLHGGEVIGLLTLEQVGHCYNQAEEAQIALTFANHAGVAIANARLFEESQKVAVLEERDRLAHDMHDGLVQTLSFLNMKLDATQTHLASGQSKRTHGDLVRMREVVTQAYEDLRELIVGLKDSPHPDVRLEEMIQERLKSLYSEGKTSVQLITDPGWMSNLEPHINRQIAIIIQEAMLNVYKHAQADNARIHLCQNGDVIQIMIEDDGKGFRQEQYLNSKKDQTHFGLDIMRDRAESIGGSLIIKSKPGNGTRVELSIPADGLHSTHNANK